MDIANFVVVSRSTAEIVFGECPPTVPMVGGGLVVAGGLVIQPGAP